MKKRKIKFLLMCTVIIVSMFGMYPSAGAMHIMEGFLPVQYCIAWGCICIPFLILGLRSIKKHVNESHRTLLILVMAGAFTFVLSALKIPSLTGSSSHPTGTGLGAILFGPCTMSVIGVIVLLFQALLLAHGGITTLGANTFSMAVAGPFVSYAVFKICEKIKLNKTAGVFLAASLGDLVTYVVTSFQLALAYPSESGGVGASMIKFMGVFAVTQIPLAVVEGLLTVIVIMGLEKFAKPELEDLKYEVNAR